MLLFVTFLTSMMLVVGADLKGSIPGGSANMVVSNARLRQQPHLNSAPISSRLHSAPNSPLPTKVSNGLYQPAAYIDYSPFHKQIKLALDSSKGIIHPFDAHNSTSSDCSMPESSIMFTYTNEGAFDLIELQHSAMTVWNLHTCMWSRFIVVCLDSGCMEKCELKTIGNCVLLSLPPTPPSNFLQGAYVYLTWFKQELIREALVVVEEAMFFDADVLLLRNPWVYTQSGRFQNTSRIYKPYDLMFQRDRGRYIDDEFASCFHPF